jgi:hypothetical protein
MTHYKLSKLDVAALRKCDLISVQSLTGNLAKLVSAILVAVLVNSRAPTSPATIRTIATSWHRSESES